jgi:hypothetical protein
MRLLQEVIREWRRGERPSTRSPNDDRVRCFDRGMLTQAAKCFEQAAKCFELCWLQWVLWPLMRTAYDYIRGCHRAIRTSNTSPSPSWQRTTSHSSQASPTERMLSVSTATDAHLKPGSLRVSQGDRVAAGRLRAHTGNAGNALGRHLHFHVSDAAEPLSGEGMPFALQSSYLVRRIGPLPEVLDGSAWQSNAAQPARVVSGETPLENMVVRFAAPARESAGHRTEGP